MKQTAVKKLELKLLGIISFDSEELRKKYKDTINQANKMFEEQIKEAYQQGFTRELGNRDEDLEQYYNETFKKD